MYSMKSLIDQYEAAGLAESNFRGNLKTKDENKKNQIMWEVHFACLLLNKGLKLKRPVGNKGGLDFYMEYENEKIWFECSAPEEGEKKNKVQGILEYKEEDTFESGILINDNKNNMKLRITQCICEKIKQRQRAIAKNIMSNDESCILVINLSRAFGGWGNIQPVFNKIIMSVLYEKGDRFFNQKGQIVVASNCDLYKNDKLIKNDYFLDDEFPYHAIVYSAASNFLTGELEDSLKYVLHSKAETKVAKMMDKYFGTKARVILKA
ncbi:hypothetical protein K8S19_05925 [bacterium]|nr:hypothetical protein [bacterium]